MKMKQNATITMFLIFLIFLSDVRSIQLKLSAQKVFSAFNKGRTIMKNKGTNQKEDNEIVKKALEYIGDPKGKAEQEEEFDLSSLLPPLNSNDKEIINQIGKKLKKKIDISEALSFGAGNYLRDFDMDANTTKYLCDKIKKNNQYGNNRINDKESAILTNLMVPQNVIDSISKREATQSDLATANEILTAAEAAVDASGRVEYRLINQFKSSLSAEAVTKLMTGGNATSKEYASIKASGLSIRDKVKVMPSTEISAALGMSQANQGDGGVNKQVRGAMHQALSQLKKKIKKMQKTSFTNGMYALMLKMQVEKKYVENLAKGSAKLEEIEKIENTIKAEIRMLCGYSSQSKPLNGEYQQLAERYNLDFKNQDESKPKAKAICKAGSVVLQIIANVKAQINSTLSGPTTLKLMDTSDSSISASCTNMNSEYATLQSNSNKLVEKIRAKVSSGTFGSTVDNSILSKMGADNPNDLLNTFKDSIHTNNYMTELSCDPLEQEYSKTQLSMMDQIGFSQEDKENIMNETLDNEKIAKLCEAKIDELKGKNLSSDMSKEDLSKISAALSPEEADEAINGNISGSIEEKLNSAGAMPSSLSKSNSEGSKSKFYAEIEESQFNVDGLGTMQDKVQSIISQTGSKSSSFKESVNEFFGKASKAKSGPYAGKFNSSDLINIVYGMGQVYRMSDDKTKFSSFDSFSTGFMGKVDQNGKFKNLQNNIIFKRAFDIFQEFKPKQGQKGSQLKVATAIDAFTTMVNSLSTSLRQQLTSDQKGSLSFTDYQINTLANKIATKEYKYPANKINDIQSLSDQLKSQNEKCYRANKDNKYYYQMLKLVSDSATSGDPSEDAEKAMIIVEQSIISNIINKVQARSVPVMLNAGFCDVLKIMATASGLLFLNKEMRDSPAGYNNSVFIKVLSASLGSQANETILNGISDFFKQNVVKIQSIKNIVETNSAFVNAVVPAIQKIGKNFSLDDFKDKISSGESIAADPFIRSLKTSLSKGGKSILLNLSPDDDKIKQSENDTNLGTFSQKKADTEMLNISESVDKYNSGRLMPKIHFSQDQMADYSEEGKTALVERSKQDNTAMQLSQFLLQNSSAENFSTLNDPQAFAAKIGVEIKQQGGEISQVELPDLIIGLGLTRIFQGKYADIVKSDVARLSAPLVTSMINQALKNDSQPVRIKQSFVAQMYSFLKGTLQMDYSSSGNSAAASFGGKYGSDIDIIQQLAFKTKPAMKNLMFTRISATSEDQIDFQADQMPSQFASNFTEKASYIDKNVLKSDEDEKSSQKSVFDKLKNLQTGKVESDNDKVSLLYFLCYAERVFPEEDKPSKKSANLFTKTLARYTSTYEPIKLKEGILDQIISTFKSKYKPPKKIDLTKEETKIQQNIPAFILSTLGSLSDSLRKQLVQSVYNPLDNPGQKSKSAAEAKAEEAKLKKMESSQLMEAEIFQDGTNYTGVIVDSLFNYNNIDIVNLKVDEDSATDFIKKFYKTVGKTSNNPNKMEIYFQKTYSVIQALFSRIERKNILIPAVFIGVSRNILDFIDVYKEINNLQKPDTSILRSSIYSPDTYANSQVSAAELNKMSNNINESQNRLKEKFDWEILTFYKNAAKNVLIDKRLKTLFSEKNTVDNVMIQLSEQDLYKKNKGDPFPPEYKATLPGMLQLFIDLTDFGGINKTAMTIKTMNDNIDYLLITMYKFDFVFDGLKKAAQMNMNKGINQLITQYVNNPTFKQNLKTTVESQGGSPSVDIGAALETWDKMKQADTTGAIKYKSAKDAFNTTSMTASIHSKSFESPDHSGNSKKFDGKFVSQQMESAGTGKPDNSKIGALAKIFNKTSGSGKSSGNKAEDKGRVASQNSILSHMSQMPIGQQESIANRIPPSRNSSPGFKSEPQIPFNIDDSKYGGDSVVSDMNSGLGGDLSKLNNMSFLETASEGKLEDIIKISAKELRTIEARNDESSIEDIVQMFRIFVEVMDHMAENKHKEDPQVILKAMAVGARLASSGMYTFNKQITNQDVRALADAGERLYMASMSGINDLNPVLSSIYEAFIGSGNDLKDKDSQIDFIMMMIKGIYESQNELNCKEMLSSFQSSVQLSGSFFTVMEGIGRKGGKKGCESGSVMDKIFSYFSAQQANTIENLKERRAKLIASLLIFYNNMYAATIEQPQANLNPQDFLYQWYNSNISIDFAYFQGNILNKKPDVSFHRALNTIKTIYYTVIQSNKYISLINPADFYVICHLIDAKIGASEDKNYFELNVKMEGSGFSLNIQKMEILVQIYSDLKQGTRGGDGMDAGEIQDDIIQKLIDKTLIGTLKERENINNASPNVHFVMNKIAKDQLVKLQLSPLTEYYNEISQLYKYSLSPYRDQPVNAGVNGIKGVFKDTATRIQQELKSAHNIGEKETFVIISLMIMSIKERLTSDTYMSEADVEEAFTKNVNELTQGAYQFADSKIKAFTKEIAKLCPPDLYRQLAKLQKTGQSFLSNLGKDQFLKMIDHLAPSTKNYMESEDGDFKDNLMDALNTPKTKPSPNLMGPDSKPNSPEPNLTPEKPSLNDKMNPNSDPDNPNKSPEGDNNPNGTPKNNKPNDDKPKDDKPKDDKPKDDKPKDEKPKDDKPKDDKPKDDKPKDKPKNDKPKEERKPKKKPQEKSKKKGVKPEDQKKQEKNPQPQNRKQKPALNKLNFTKSMILSELNQSSQSSQSLKLTSPGKKPKKEQPKTKPQKPQQRDKNQKKKWEQLTNKIKYNLDPKNKEQKAEPKEKAAPSGKQNPAEAQKQNPGPKKAAKKNKTKKPNPKSKPLPKQSDIKGSPSNQSKGEVKPKYTPSTNMNQDKQALTPSNLGEKMNNGTEEHPSGIQGVKSEEVDFERIANSPWDTEKFDSDSGSPQCGEVNYGEFCSKKKISPTSQNKLLISTLDLLFKDIIQKMATMDDSSVKAEMNAKLFPKLIKGSEIIAMQYLIFLKLLQYIADKLCDSSALMPYKTILDLVLEKLFSLSTDTTPVFNLQNFYASLLTQLKLSSKSGLSSWENNRDTQHEFYKIYLRLGLSKSPPSGSTNFKKIMEQEKKYDFGKKMYYQFFFGQKENLTEKSQISQIFDYTATAADFVSSITDLKTDDLDAIFSNSVKIYTDIVREMVTLFLKIFLQGKFYEGNKKFRYEKNENQLLKDFSLMENSDLRNGMLDLWYFSVVTMVEVSDEDDQFKLDIKFNDYVTASALHLVPMFDQNSSLDRTDSQALEKLENKLIEVNQCQQIDCASDVIQVIEFIFLAMTPQEKDNNTLANLDEDWFVNYINSVGLNGGREQVQCVFDASYQLFNQHSDGPIKAEYKDRMKWPTDSLYDKLPDYQENQGEYIYESQSILLRALTNLSQQARSTFGTVDEHKLFALKKVGKYYSPNYVPRQTKL